MLIHCHNFITYILQYQCVDPHLSKLLMTSIARGEEMTLGGGPICSKTGWSGVSDIPFLISFLSVRARTRSAMQWPLSFTISCGRVHVLCKIWKWTEINIESILRITLVYGSFIDSILRIALVYGGFIDWWTKTRNLQKSCAKIKPARYSTACKVFFIESTL